MNCMKYANENNINIIPQNDFENLTKEVFMVIAHNLSRSLGPLGSSATIFDGTIVEATKDGYSILNKYKFNNQYKKMIYNLIKKPCTKLNNSVGDGTTTAVTLTYNLFNRYQEYKNTLFINYRLPRQLTSAWDEVVNELSKRIKSRSHPIDPDDYDTIYNLAYVTSNGNNEISKAFADAYKTAKTPAIKMKNSPTTKSYLKQIEGFEFPANVIDPIYVRNEDLTANEKNVAVVILDHKVETDEFETLYAINEVYRAMERKFLVIAPVFDEKMLDSTANRWVNYELQKYGKINMILAQYRGSKLQSHQLDDLATILKAKVITKDLMMCLQEDLKVSSADWIVEQMSNPEYNYYRFIGTALSAMISVNNGSIFTPDNIESDEIYQSVLRVAEVDLQDAMNNSDNEAQSYSAKIYDARSRLLQLQMKNFIYYIGAESQLQKQILEDAVDDVIKCLRSSVKNGIVPGCQLSLIQSCQEYFDELDKLTGDAPENGLKSMAPVADENINFIHLKQIICHMIKLAAMDTYMQVLVGPDGTGIIKTIDKWPYWDEDKISELHNVANIKANDIINESIERMEVFDLEKEDFNPDIITSAETDVMVLMASSELIKILISGNQCIFINANFTESEELDVNNESYPS